MSAPDPKAKKYDRQLRIWGAHGQAALESACICLLHCGPTGTETLKNLVLGGIASFTVVDASKVEARDLGNNFLLDAASLGSSRAQSTTNLLQELNDAVAGSYVDEAPEALISGNPGFFASFDMVIATQMVEQHAVQLEGLCRPQGIKLLYVRSYGLLGSLRASCEEQTILESKPENAVQDLRLTCPWPELASHAASLDLDSLDDVTHRHIPYAVLLIKAVERWRGDHGGSLPASSKDKAAFRQLLQSWQRTIDGVPVEEENFTEAIEASRRALVPVELSSEVQAVLGDEMAASLTPASSDFWIMATALRGFVDQEGGGKLPVQPSIPDMWSTTALFLELQRLYRAKADADGAAVQRHVAARLRSLGRSPDAIPVDSVRMFVRNAASLRVVRFPKLAEVSSHAAGNAIKGALAAEDSAANAGAALLLRAADRFHVAHSRFPGEHDGTVEEDVPLLKQTLNAVLAEMGLQGAGAIDDLVAEVCRFGAGELHCVAAIMGGIAAQEAIKLLTRQFVPLSGLLLYNAMASTSSVFRL